MSFDADVFRRRVSRVAMLLFVTTTTLWFAPAVSLGQDQTLSLSDLEHGLVDSPALAAADTQIFGAEQTVNFATDRLRGFDYFFDNDLGPRSDIVTGTTTNRTFRYGQLIGVQFPLFGTHLTQRLELTQARSQVNLAKIESEADRRKLLARLRDSYIKYWQFDREQEIIAKYLALGNAEAPAARAFARTGFWTQANYLGFLDGLYRFRTDLSALRSARRSALADMRAVLNSDIPERAPQTPDFNLTCSPGVDQAVAVAAGNDPEIARLQEQQDEAKQSLDFVGHSTLEAHMRFGVGTNVDIPQGTVGYNVTAAFGVLFPQHAKPEETAKREGIYANIQTYHFLEMQRRAEIRAEVMRALDEADTAHNEYLQAQHEQVAAREVLREARVRQANISSPGATGFAEVQTRILDSYAAERRETSELGATYVRVNELETLVPSTCLPLRLDGPLLRQ